VILASLVAAREAIARRNINRFLALWGDCSISVASFTALPEKYGDDLGAQADVVALTIDECTPVG